MSCCLHSVPGKGGGQGFDRGGKHHGTTFNMWRAQSAGAWLVNVSLPQTLGFLITSHASSFRSTSPECSSPDHLTAPLIIRNSVRHTGPERKVRSAALRRKARLIAKSLCFVHLYSISQNFGTLDPPDSWPQGCPPNNVFNIQISQDSLLSWQPRWYEKKNPNLI